MILQIWMFVIQILNKYWKNIFIFTEKLSKNYVYFK